MAEIRIGTSGWHYKHWLGTYYPENLPNDRMLSHYIRDFDTVELNNSFYHLPKPESFLSWRRNTPAKFVFAVKGSRFITHMKKLKDPEPALEKFLPGPESLGRKLGPILWQLPPHWKVNLERLEAFLQALPKHHRYTFELRDPSWLTRSVYQLLEKYDAAFCIYEIAGFHSPVLTTADFAYVRLHGPTEQAYQGSYDSGTLRAWSDWIEKTAKRVRQIYVYFDNDQAGYAATNAIALRRMVMGEAQARVRSA